MEGHKRDDLAMNPHRALIAKSLVSISIALLTLSCSAPSTVCYLKTLPHRKHYSGVAITEGLGGLIFAESSNCSVYVLNTQHLDADLTKLWSLSPYEYKGLRPVFVDLEGSISPPEKLGQAAVFKIEKANEVSLRFTEEQVHTQFWLRAHRIPTRRAPSDR